MGEISGPLYFVMYFCKKCKKHVLVHRESEKDVYLWKHLYEAHIEEYKKVAPNMETEDMIPKYYEEK